MMLISLVSQVLFNAYAFLCCVFIDTTIFLCVDRCCKVLLSRCVTLSEKRDIWLFESLTLFGLSSILFIYHHYPILLWILGVITFTSATLTGRVDSQFYWDALKTYWREFSDQQEHLNAAGEDAAHSVAPTGLYKNQVSEEQCREYMRQGDVQINNDNAVNTSSIGEGLKALHYNEKKATYELIKPVRYASRSSTSARYRGAANSLVTQVDVSETDTAKTPSLLDNLEGFGSKVWSYLGLAAIYTKNDLPPGLSSSGSNLCFLNSVLQCIARAPNLADELAEEVKSCRSQDVRRLAFLDAVTEVLQQINVINRESGISLVDTQALCQAGALLNSDLLVQPEKYQPQQDACELLTWLLHEIHEAINEAKGQKLEGSQDESMRKLKTVYGNISESYTKMMKEECKAQIAGANGFTDAELPELVQNLANLEWITYRRTNRSVVDGLFTFQCIELQMCSSCNLTSVNVQSMAMLSFPVAKHATSIHLSSCLTDFVAHERLYGRDGLQCSRCQSNALAIPQTPSQRQQSPCIQSELLSPIQGDKTLPNRDAQFLSSTPLLDQKLKYV
ncbi:uncharacterized protein [Watersipora subatra]|uniref:uncharacterized protein isoform X2 n=1 Tax=Watersipora subatra TaxID=2589382 RepID=UPI00355C2AEE